MSACRGIFVVCNSRWGTYLVSGLRNIEVCAIQGCNKCIVNVSFLGPRDSVLFIEVSVFKGNPHFGVPLYSSSYFCYNYISRVEFEVCKNKIIRYMYEQHSLS